MRDKFLMRLCFLISAGLIPRCKQRGSIVGSASAVPVRLKPNLHNRYPASLLWGSLLSLCLCLFAPMRGFADDAELQQALSQMKVSVPQKIVFAPAFDLPGFKTSSMRLSDYKGKLVLLNFWASFCAPCRVEMPALENLWQRYRDQGFVVLALSADRDNLKQVEQLIKDGGYSFPVLLDTEGEVRKIYEVRALPTSYLIGRDGKFIGRIIGEREWDSVDGRKLIKLLLSR